MLRRALSTFILVVSIGAPAWGASLGSKISRGEFETLVVELAPKVDAFRAVWMVDPEAKIFGGASRDFALYLVSRFRDADTPDKIEAVKAQLRKVGTIQSREFLRSDSDLDVVTSKTNLPRGAEFAIGKIESINTARLNPETNLGQNEIQQGSLPSEKILLTLTSVETATGFGDGLGEVYSNRPTLRVPDMGRFWQTHYAQEKLNHPILLATRFLRLVSNLQFAHEGPEVPFPVGSLDKVSLEFVKGAVTAASDRNAFNEFLAQPKFVEWLTKNLFSLFGRKSNLQTTDVLMKVTGLEALVKERNLLPLNHLKFSADSSRAGDETIRKNGVEPMSLFEDVREIVPELQLFHGTKQESYFQLIVRDGFVPSENGLIGSGLYSVARPELVVTRDYTHSNDKLVIGFPFDQDARVVDLRKPGIEAMIMKIAAAEGWTGGRVAILNRAAAALGIDAYVYTVQTNGSGPQRAFLIKNGAVLGKPYGLNRKVVTFELLLTRATKVKTDAELLALADSIRDSGMSETQVAEIAEQIKGHEGVATARSLVKHEVVRTGLERMQSAFTTFAFQQQVYMAAEAADHASETQALKEANDTFGTILSDLRTSEFQAAAETFQIISTRGFDLSTYVQQFRQELKYTVQIDPWVPMLGFALKRIAKGTVTEPIVMAITYFFLVKPSFDFYHYWERLGGGAISRQMLLEAPATSLIGPLLYFGFWIWGIRHALAPKVKEMRAAQNAKREKIKILRGRLDLLDQVGSRSKAESGNRGHAPVISCPNLFTRSRAS